MDRILVTGASGLLGSNFVLQAAGLNQHVTAVFHQHPLALPGVIAVGTDLTDEKAVRRLIREHHPDWIIHCAAATNVDWCESHPAEAFRQNRDATQYLAEEAREIGAGMVYVSTDAVFEGGHGCYREESQPNPQNTYASSKLAGEKAVQAALARHVIFRGTMFGWNMQPKQSLAEWFLSALEAGSTAPGFSDVFFSPLLVNDMSEMIQEGMRRGIRGCYHIGSRDACSKLDFGRRIAAEFGLDQGLVVPSLIEETVPRAKRPKNTSLNTDKAAEALGHAMPSVASGIGRFRHLRDEGFAARLKTLGDSDV